MIDIRINMGTRQSRRKRWRRWTGIAAATIIILIGIAVGYVYWMLQKSLPTIEGMLEIDSLRQPVSVWRDKSGVPHIEAKNEHDLYLAQGFITAQDRLFQMDYSKRLASGTLSEILGPRAVEADKFYRLFGLRRAAEASLKQYTPEAMEMLVAYAQGVNAYIRSVVKNNALPMEFRLLRYRPEEWLPVDSLTIGKYMAFNEGGHWAGLAFRYQLTQLVSEEKAKDLFPTYPEYGPTIIQAIKKQPVALNDLLRVADVPDPYIGSNNWVLSGAKSASGKPMLANDPHLSLSLPAIWYETNLVAPGLNVSGVNIPGIPGILLGHNEHIAWGITNMGPDAMDLYIEKRNPNNKKKFEYMGKWEPATVYKEHIEVKGADPVEYEILTTRHGPIISEFAKDNKPDTALALRWTALEPSTEIETVRRFALARDWNEFAQALNFFQAPAQNFVFASDDGTIAYKGNGLIPIRKKGNGSLPVPGWTDEYEWTGYIPWKELPTVVNPPEGFIATANNKIINNSYPYHITDDWGDAYRATRIRQALESKAILSEEDMQKLQFDRHNMQAEQFLAGLLETFKGDAALRGIDKDAIELLKKWNKEDDPDLGAPLIFNEWIQHFDEVFRPEISDDLMRFFENKDTAMNEMLRKALTGEKEPWIDAKGGIKQVALRAFQAALDKISGIQGKDASKWQWGNYHKVRFYNGVSSNLGFLGRLLNSKLVAIGGSGVTVGRASSYNGEINFGAPWRTVIDLANPLQAYSVLGPGQSGQYLSPWYLDQVGDWTTGRYHVTSMNPDEYQAAGYHLKLVPAS